jgi:tetrapyrrole methylase family protein / MazG family protein
MGKKKNKISAAKSFEELVRIVKILRSDKGCPWDRKQKLPDVKNYILEEVYELCEAVGKKDSESIKEEVGDLFLLLVFISLLCEEKEIFNVQDSLETAVNKLIYRHPHVFSSEQASSSNSVLEKWIKRKHRQKKRKTLFQRIPQNSPALLSLFLYFRELKGLKGIASRQIEENLLSLCREERFQKKKKNLTGIIFYAACLLSNKNFNPELLLFEEVKKQASRVFYESGKGKKAR